MNFFRNKVLVKTPRKSPALGLSVFGLIALLWILVLSFVVVPDLRLFSLQNRTVTIDSVEMKLFSGIFFVFLFFSLCVAVVRNNTKSQPIEIVLFAFGLISFLIFAFFSTPLLFLWAHIHGYYLDHYEAARRGGWYIFKPTGS